MAGQDEPNSDSPGAEQPERQGDGRAEVYGAEREGSVSTGPAGDGPSGQDGHEATHDSEVFGDEGLEEPVDLSVLQSDDALLDALGGADPQVPDEIDDRELSAVLLAWRRDIDSEPVPELVDHDYAVATLRSAQVSHRNGGKHRRRRMLVPVAAAAAVLAVTFGGVGLAARDAEPGDALWSLTKVLYTDHARSVQAASSARTDLQRASVALSSGDLQRARAALAAAQTSMEAVTDEDIKDLRSRHAELRSQIDGNGGNGGGTQDEAPGGAGDGSSSPEESDSSSPSSPPDSTSPSTPPDTSTSPSPSTTTPPNSGGSGDDTGSGRSAEDSGGSGNQPGTGDPTVN